MEGLTPGVKLSLNLTGKTDAKLSAEALKELTAEPGASKDLGDIRVQVVRAKKQSRGDDR
jgi:hypothetical protein